jgi:LCP family protein required for cell wall assembly
VTGVRLERGQRRNVLLVIIATQLVVALITGLVITLAYNKLDKNFTSGQPIEHVNKKKHLIGGDPLNILVMGSDSRVGPGNNVDGQTDIGQRSDTTILVHVSADRKTVYGVSLPRDALVTRPDCTTPDGKTVPGAELQFFNAAYSLAGPACTAKQVDALTGIYIDHYVSVDFNGFKDMVDAVHGVTVCIPEDVDDSAHGITFKAGTQELDGQQALNYVRERYVLSANSDIGRMKRQQAFIASMVHQVISANTLANPVHLLSFLEAATKSLQLDTGLGNLVKIAKLGVQFKHIGLDRIQFITVPWQYAPEDPNRIRWLPAAKQVWQTIINDKPMAPRFLSDAINAQQPPGSPSPSPSPSGTPSGSPSASPSGSPSSPSTPSSTPSSQSTQDAAQQAAENGLCA